MASDKERVGCTRAAGVMLLVCGVPTLAIGLVLLLILQQLGSTKIAGIVMLVVAGIMILCGIACSIAACTLQLKKKVGDSYNQNAFNNYNQYRMRRGSQTTCYTTATMETVATRLTVAPPLSHYNLPDDEAPPPAYMNTSNIHQSAWDTSLGPDHPAVANQGAFLQISPITENGQEFGMQRF